MKTAICWTLFLYSDGFPVPLAFSLAYDLSFVSCFSSLILSVICFAYVFIGFCVWIWHQELLIHVSIKSFKWELLLLLRLRIHDGGCSCFRFLQEHPRPMSRAQLEKPRVHPHTNLQTPRLSHIPCLSLLYTDIYLLCTIYWFISYSLDLPQFKCRYTAGNGKS